MKIIQFFKSLTLVILTSLTLLKFLFLKKKKANFFVINKNEHSLIDRRSRVYVDDKTINNSINFIRSQSFILSLRTYFMYKNLIFFNQIFNLIVTIGVIIKLNRQDIIKIYKKILSFIIKITGIEFFYSFDDYRNIEIFSDLCFLNKVNLQIYQHGRISKSLYYQKSLSKLKFDNFYVWSNFFKKKLIEFNPDYRLNKIIIKNRFNFKKQKNNHKNKIKKILIIHEDGIAFNKIKKIVNKLSSNTSYKIFFKFRPNNEINELQKNYLIKNDIKIFHREDIYKIMIDEKFNALIGFNTSLLLECSYFNIFPILIYEKNTVLKDYIIEKVLFTSNINEIKKSLKQILKKKNELTKIKNKIWN